MRLVVTFLLLVWFAEPALADDYLHEETGLRFPAQIQGLTRGEEKPYQAGQFTGVAVPYSAEGAEATIFVRSGDDTSSVSAQQLVDEVLATVDILEERGNYSDVKLYESDGSGDRPGWAMAAFSARVNGKAIISFTHAKIHKGCVVKIRTTLSLPLDRSLLKFIQEVQDLVDGVEAGTEADEQARAALGCHGRGLMIC